MLVHLLACDAGLAVELDGCAFLGSGHTESGLPLWVAICARGGKAFEL